MRCKSWCIERALSLQYCQYYAWVPRTRTHTIRAVSANGTISSLFASTATTPFVHGVAVDAASNVYFANVSTATIMRVRANDSKLDLVAGIGIPGHSGDDGPASSSAVGGLLVLATYQQFLYIADHQDTSIRRVDLRDGTIARVVGSAMPAEGYARPATSASVLTTALVVNADAMYTLTALGPTFLEVLNTSTWDISPVAGNGLNAYGGDDGPASSASLRSTLVGGIPGYWCFEYQFDLAVARDGTVYVAETVSNRDRSCDAHNRYVDWQR